MIASSIARKMVPALGLVSLLAASHVSAAPAKAAMNPLPASVIYTIYPNIFSTQGNFAGIDAQLGRLKKLGVDIVWIMPITPIGQAVGSHPAFGSPYCVENYYGINPSYGDGAALHHLVDSAHALGMKVILDQVLNHTSWDNPLIHKHPEFYVHSGSDVSNPDSIQQAFNFSDVAQLDYTNHDLWAYMNQMLTYWIKEYKVDGYRFDTANDPDGPKRRISAAFWQQLGDHLRAVKSDVILLGECETPDLAEKPFQIDYGWQMYGALKSAIASGGSAQDLRTTWNKQTDDFPPGMLHMAVQDDWDMPRDINTFGGPSGAKAVAFFDFTINGIPLIYNGMEIGNTAEAVNPHKPIDWSNADPSFTPFYERLIALRHKHPALQQGPLTWLDNSASQQVVTYLRGKPSGEQFLITINMSANPAQGTVSGLPAGKWVDITAQVGGKASATGDATKFKLEPKEYAIYCKTGE